MSLGSGLLCSVLGQDRGHSGPRAKESATSIPKLKWFSWKALEPGHVFQTQGAGSGSQDRQQDEEAAAGTVPDSHMTIPLCGSWGLCSVRISCSEALWLSGPGSPPPPPPRFQRHMGLIDIRWLQVHQGGKAAQLLSLMGLPGLLNTSLCEIYTQSS